MEITTYLLTLLSTSMLARSLNSTAGESHVIHLLDISNITRIIIHSAINDTPEIEAISIHAGAAVVQNLLNMQNLTLTIIQPASESNNCNRQWNCDNYVECLVEARNADIDMSCEIKQTWKVLRDQFCASNPNQSETVAICLDLLKAAYDHKVFENAGFNFTNGKYFTVSQSATVSDKSKCESINATGSPAVSESELDKNLAACLGTKACTDFVGIEMRDDMDETGAVCKQTVNPAADAPEAENRSKFCSAIDTFEKDWTLIDCGSSRPYICSYSVLTNEVITNTLIDRYPSNDAKLSALTDQEQYFEQYGSKLNLTKDIRQSRGNVEISIKSRDFEDGTFNVTSLENINGTAVEYTFKSETPIASITTLVSLYTVNDAEEELTSWSPPPRSQLGFNFVTAGPLQFLTVSAIAHYFDGTSQPLRVGSVRYTMHPPVLGDTLHKVMQHPTEAVRVRRVRESCVFLDAKAGYISTEGCTPKIDARSKVIECVCNHFTVFSSLMALETVTVPLGAKIASYVTESLSILSLIATVAILSVYKNDLNSNRTSVQLNLSLALMLFHVVSMFHDPALDNNQSCEAAAIATHYFLLATGMWLLVEAARVFMATMLPLWFQTRDSDTLLKVFIVFGWVLPGIVVTLAAWVGWDDYMDEVDYTGFEFYFENGTVRERTHDMSPKYIRCWLAPGTSVFYGSVFIPLSLALAINLATGVIVSASTLKAKNMQKRKQHWGHDDLMRAVRSLLLLMTLFGITWILALFTGLDNTGTSLVFMYLHSVVNGLQGLLIFFIYVFMNSQLPAKMFPSKEQ